MRVPSPSEGFKSGGTYMDWFYNDAGQAKGPIPEEQFVSLIQQGVVTGDTLVWRDGMKDWKSCHEAGPKISSRNPYAPGVQNCVQCGKQFLQDEMMKYENSWVCVGCKPIFLQKLKEGIQTDASLVYAGFWIRVGAKIIDGIILQIVNYALKLPLSAIMGGDNHPGFNPLFFAQMALSMILGIGFTTFFLGKFSATPGKMACRLKVVNPDGTPITYLKAFARFWGEMVSTFTICIGYLIVAWDEEKRGLHDRICNTRVIKVS